MQLIEYAFNAGTTMVCDGLDRGSDIARSQSLALFGSQWQSRKSKSTSIVVVRQEPRNGLSRRRDADVVCDRMPGTGRRVQERNRSWFCLRKVKGVGLLR